MATSQYKQKPMKINNTQINSSLVQLIDNIWNIYHSIQLETLLQGRAFQQDGAKQIVHVCHHHYYQAIVYTHGAACNDYLSRNYSVYIELQLDRTN